MTQNKWKCAMPMALVCVATFIAGFVNVVCLSIMQGDQSISFVNIAIGTWLFVSVLPLLVVLCGRWYATAIAYVVTAILFCAHAVIDASTWEPEVKEGCIILAALHEEESMYDGEDNGLVKIFCAFKEALIKTSGDKEISDALLFLAKVPEKERKGRSMQLCLDRADPLSPLTDSLKHLRVKDGWALDCFVEGSADSAANAKFCMRKGEETSDVKYVLDGTPESAWERVLMDFAETQFFLVWHACVAEQSIVTSAKRFKFEASTLKGGAKAWNSFSPLTRLRLRWEDLRPLVSIEDGEATVSYCSFSPFHGLIRRYCRVNLKTGNVKHEDYEMLAPYCCGVVF